MVRIHVTDTRLAHSVKDLADITNGMSSELKYFKVWLHGIKSSLNVAND